MTNVSNEPAFTIVDVSGNTLHFDQFAYERSIEKARGDYHDANWIRCRITLQASTLKQSVHAALLTTEIKELAETLRVALLVPGTETTFTSMEPYIDLNVIRRDRYVDVTARLDLAPALGPVVEFRFECRPEDIEATLGTIGHVQELFPER